MHVITWLVTAEQSSKSAFRLLHYRFSLDERHSTEFDSVLEKVAQLTLFHALIVVCLHRGKM